MRHHSPMNTSTTELAQLYATRVSLLPLPCRVMAEETQQVSWTGEVQHQIYYLTDVIYRILWKSLESSNFHSGVSTLLGYTIFCKMGKTRYNGTPFKVCGWVFVGCWEFEGDGWWDVYADTSSQEVSWVSLMLFLSLELGLVLNILLGGESG